MTLEEYVEKFPGFADNRYEMEYAVTLLTNKRNKAIHACSACGAFFDEKNSGSRHWICPSSRDAIIVPVNGMVEYIRMTQ